MFSQRRRTEQKSTKGENENPNQRACGKNGDQNVVRMLEAAIAENPDWRTESARDHVGRFQEKNHKRPEHERVHKSPERSALYNFFLEDDFTNPSIDPVVEPVGRKFAFCGEDDFQP